MEELQQEVIIWLKQNPLRLEIIKGAIAERLQTKMQEKIDLDPTLQVTGAETLKETLSFVDDAITEFGEYVKNL